MSLQEKERFLVTSALPYANGYIHLGHCAGAYLPADIYVRFLRLMGKPTLWICGSDEHGVAITIAAEKEGVSPKEIIDKYHFANKEAFDKFGMSFDIYSRTSLPIHHETAREFFRDFLQKGYLIEREEEQFFDPVANMFLPDRYVEGVCPNCGYNQARGDQCDNCGAYYNQLDLISPKSLISGQKPIVKKTTHWFFRFDLFQEFMENYIESHAKDWKENVVQQSRSWLKQGMKERAITRDLSWGVSIEGIEGIDPAKAKGKVMYVWFEAVLGYISGTKHLVEELRKKNNSVEFSWEDWWKNENTHYIAFIGKDNIVFHTLLFPTILYARNEGFILPENVPANEFLNLEGQKFSKSRNWTIDLKDFIEEFPNASSIDALRYALACNLPETKDSDFSWKDFQTRNNSELASIFGNFVNRTIQFLHKNFGGKVPTLSDKYKNLRTEWDLLVSQLLNDENISNNEFQSLGPNEIELARGLVKSFQNATHNLYNFKFRDAVFEIMNSARFANKYFNDEEPWKTLKSNPEQCAKTLFLCSQLLYSFAVFFSPIIPFTTEKLFESLGKTPTVGQPNYGTSQENTWERILKLNLDEGDEIKNPNILFPNIDDKIIQKQIDKLGKSPEDLWKEKSKDRIKYEDFSKVQLRTAKITHAERVKKSKKLIKLQIDLGNETRQIVAGIGEHYSPEELLGKTIVVVVNLEPAKLMGVESDGMLLAASTQDGSKLTLITTLTEIEPGSVVK
ncbi:MAG: Methionyl-tRNA synthetase [Candidatus Kapaibacterium sp.]|jgi:methionyl-tRNA synthetase|nr:MAG: Methionyl-tRNA synthetase [Candidatus Kapabacteria bacterium]ROL58162.1 MAG: methionine--tRNA ligase [Bacteroidetes/Chlorobi group bacterium Naka2016]